MSKAKTTSTAPDLSNTVLAERILYPLITPYDIDNKIKSIRKKQKEHNRISESLGYNNIDFIYDLDYLNFKIHPYMFIERVLVILNSIYKTDKYEWFLSKYNKNEFIICFGEFPYKQNNLSKSVDFNKAIFFRCEENNLDCIAIGWDTFTLFNSQLIASKIFSTIKMAGF